MGRLDARSELKRQILKRYRFECAACGVAGELKADVAHLFEDATTRRPSADRLIVLCPNCNQAEVRAKDRSKPPLSEALDAEEVTVRARRAYRDGKYNSAYAGHRLAAYLFETGRSYSRAVSCLIEATSALRPIRWGDFLTATLLEVERLCLSRDEVGLVQRWLCLDRFSLVLYDYRQWQQSAQVQYAAEQLRVKVTTDQRYPDDLKFDRASSFRREALIKASTASVSRRAARKLIDRLLEDAREFESQGQFDRFATNLDVASKIQLEICENPTEAHRNSERALERATKITHKWVLQEHHWREVDYYHFFMKDRSRKLNSIVAALRLYHDHPVVLEPTLGAAGPTQHDPIAELRRYGISDAELREHGVAASGNPPPELPLQLPKRRLEGVVRNLMR